MEANSFQKPQMENKNPDEDSRETEENSYEEFICCVCLDLLYKPVVLACGHISCFWCVFQSMNPWHESYCPVCRHPFNHFPSICQLLHFVLVKLFPLTLKRREIQVTEDEKKYGDASPHLPDQLSLSSFTDESDMLIIRSHSDTSVQINSCSQTSCTPKENPSKVMDTAESTVREYCCNPSILSLSSGTSESPGTSLDAGNNVIQGTSLVENNHWNGVCKNVSCADLLCLGCKNLLFQPVVLNCGHVYCESCIISLQDGVIRCQVCQSIHPNGLPKVCLVLEHLLEVQFPEIYTQRRDALSRQAASQNGSTSNGAIKSAANQSILIPKNDYLSWWTGRGPKVHMGVGCDYCGMHPIVGERYKCKDCVEQIGFDLCERCYNTPSKLPGRFSQQHRPEHKFEVVEPGIAPQVLLRLEAEESEDDDSNSAPHDQPDTPSIL